MGRIFDIEGPLMSGLTKMADIMIVNALFLLCSLPVVTIGASITAMYYVTLKMVKNEESYIVRSFFKSFKQNFVQATVIWLLTLLTGFILYVDFKIVSGQYAESVSLPVNIRRVILVFVIAAGIFYMFVAAFVFPQLAKFDNTIKNTIKNAFLMSVGHFPMAIAIIVITVVPVFAILWMPSLLFFIFIIFGLIAYCNSFLFMKIYRKYIPENEIASDTDFALVTENTETNDYGEQ